MTSRSSSARSVSARISLAFVMGAGLGTRLRPLTDRVPKPLIPIFGKPLITFALDHLKASGVTSFVINTHHLADQFDQAFAGGSYAGCPVRLVHEPILLETGGGIKNAEPFLGTDPFIVYSGDILTDIDVDALIEEHFRQGNDVTLALRETGLAAGVALENGRVVDIRNKHGRGGGYDFANVSVWNPSVFGKIPPATKTSFVPILLEWMTQGGKIGGLVLNERSWFNVGSRTEYLNVHRVIAEQSWRPAYLPEVSWPVRVAPDAVLAPSVHLSGFHAIGAGCVLEDNVTVENSILWPGTKLTSDACVRDCIAMGSLVISGIHDNVDL